MQLSLCPVLFYFILPPRRSPPFLPSRRYSPCNYKARSRRALGTDSRVVEMVVETGSLASRTLTMSILPFWVCRIPIIGMFSLCHISEHSWHMKDLIILLYILIYLPGTVYRQSIWVATRVYTSSWACSGVLCAGIKCRTWKSGLYAHIPSLISLFWTNGWIVGRNFFSLHLYALYTSSRSSCMLRSEESSTRRTYYPRKQVKLTTFHPLFNLYSY